MALGATTYTSVTWTTGDVITEAKLDNMVANEQAYDSHASNGIMLNNNVGYYQKDSGGTARAVANLDASDLLTWGDGTNMEVATATMGKCSVYMSANHNIDTATLTKIQYNTEVFDIGSDYDTSNYRFTAPVTGYYHVVVQAYIDDIDDGDFMNTFIYVNASLVKRSPKAYSPSDGQIVGAACVGVVSATAGQYIEGYAQHNEGATQAVYQSDGSYTYMNIHLLSV